MFCLGCSSQWFDIIGFRAGVARAGGPGRRAKRSAVCRVGVVVGRCKLGATSELSRRVGGSAASRRSDGSLGRFGGYTSKDKRAGHMRGGPKVSSEALHFDFVVASALRIDSDNFKPRVLLFEEPLVETKRLANGLRI